MRIYDISQEVFTCEVYPGDPAPQREVLCSMEKGDTYSLTAFSMCAHNGTHVDAPKHFLLDGASIEKMALHKTVGDAFVAEHDGVFSAEDAFRLLNRMYEAGRYEAKRILLKGNAVLSVGAAEAFAKAKIDLFGNESQTVGTKEDTENVHRILLGAEVALLEGVRLKNVAEGWYFLCAAPLSLGGAEGAPCRAILIDREDMRLRKKNDEKID